MTPQANVEKLVFADDKKNENEPASMSGDNPVSPWKVAIIDDDEVVHNVSRLVLTDFKFKERPLILLDGYSGTDARRLFSEHPDIAVALLDVVMESDNAGLEVVRYIRETLENQVVRIILRTGQPGQAPERQIISDYDINDYKEKSDLTAQKLVTAVTTALRAYSDLMTIKQLATSNEHLEELVEARTKALSDTNAELMNEIQDRMKILDTLHHKQMLLDEAQRIAGIGNYGWNLETDEMTWSDQIYQIFGYRPENTPSSYTSLIGALYPEERDRVMGAIKTAISAHATFDLEHRVLNPNGRIGFVQHQGEVFLDRTGRPCKVVGTVQDITERYLSEEHMKKLSTAVEQAADGVMITDKNGVIEYVNTAFTEITGFTREELLGNTPALLKSDKQGPSFYRRLWNTISRGQVFSEIVINRRKGGSLYYEEKTITPQKDRHGNITHYISTGKDITERMINQERLYHLAHHDSLTGLPNRTLFLDRLSQAIARTRRHNRQVAVLFIDMDRFKVINDTLGHGVGDKLLQKVSQALGTCVREGDTVARLGGDEFAIILNDLASQEDIPPIAEKILRTMREPVLVEERELFITTSIGISLFPDDGDNSETLLKKADVAMYHAKATGKNTYQFYGDEDESKAIEKLSLETNLRRALEREEFFLHYQPQLHLPSRKVTGMEALLRWRHPDDYVVPPLHFIPLLEETGMILPVGEWVLHTSCLHEKARQNAGLVPHRVAVNVSIHQFRQKNFAERVEAILNETKLEPCFLELEVTEGIFIDDIQTAVRILNELHELGAYLSIDDFGTGYSSMSYLRRLPFDALKIDRSFVKDVTLSRDDAAIASAIITLAHTMELEVIAEGVETIEQLDFLVGSNCDAIQGYWYSPPLPCDEVETLLRKEQT